MDSFVYTALPTRVVFGSGTVDQVQAELDRLGVTRALLITTPGQEAMAREIAERAPANIADVFAGAAMHTPVGVTEQAMEKSGACGADGYVAIGGGSAIGLSKALALRTDLPQLVIPTTYAGSEMTPILGETDKGRKTTQKTPRVLPETVIYDVDLTLEFPLRIATVSGMNAMAHAVEALYAADRNPIVSMMAEEAIRRMATALSTLMDSPADRQARSDALYAACLSGVCLGSVGMAFHHKLCHTLGGSYDLPHAETHAALLPHAFAFNAPEAPGAVAHIARALGAEDPVRALFELQHRLGVPRSLGDLGLRESDIERATELALENPYWNPRPLEYEAVREVIAQAWRGAAPV